MMMRITYAFCFLAFFSSTVLGDEKSYIAEYSIGNDEFGFLSNVIISQDDSSKMTLKFSDKQKAIPSTKVMDAIIAEDSFAVIVKYPGSNTQIKTQINICHLALANFQYVLNFGLLKEGDLLSVHLMPYKAKGKKHIPSNFKCDTLTDRKELATSIKPLSEIILKHKAKAFLPKDGFTVPVDSFETMKTESDLSSNELFKDPDTKDAEESVESQSFLRRYWYIFLPMFLMSFFGPSPPSEQQQTPPKNKKKKS